jgi:hypothetical protein
MKNRLIDILLVSHWTAFAVAAFGCSSPSPTTLEDSGASVDAGDIDGHSGDGAPSKHSDAGTPACPSFDAGATPGYPAAHPPFPNVVYGGGRILVQPEVVTVTFPADPLAPQLERFGDEILGTCWWNTLRAGYCVPGGGPCIGAGVVSANSRVELTTAPAPSYVDSDVGGPSTMQSFIQEEVASGVFPAPAPGTIYAIYPPATTTITQDGVRLCSGALSYHSQTRVTPPGGSETPVAYAIMPRCSLSNLFGSILNELTYFASHELVEAITDPAGDQKSFAINSNDLDGVPWQLFFGGGETADVCVDVLGMMAGELHGQVAALGNHGSYDVQQVWSIPAAAAGGDPCVPASDQPYFNVAIAKGSGVTQVGAGGARVTIQATAFSTGPTGGPWALKGVDVDSALYGGQPVLSVTPSSTSVSNGDQVTVDIQVLSPLPVLSPIPGSPLPPLPHAGSEVHGALFLLESSGPNGKHAWPGLIVQ